MPEPLPERQIQAHLSCLNGFDCHRAFKLFFFDRLGTANEL